MSTIPTNVPAPQAPPESHNVIKDIGRWTGEIPGGPWPDAMTGPWLGAAVPALGMSALGYGLGKIIPHFTDRFDKKRLPLGMALVGGLAGLAPSIPRLQVEVDHMRGIGPNAPAPKQASWDNPIPIAYTSSLIAADPMLSYDQKLQALQLVNEAAQGQRHGLISPGQLVDAALGAGVGWLGARALGSMMGTVFGLDLHSQKQLGNIGLVGGALLGSGVVG